MRSWKKMGDLVKCSIAFWVFHGIKFLGWRLRKSFPRENYKKMENISPNHSFLFQLLAKISIIFNHFRIFLSDTSLDCFNLCAIFSDKFSLIVRFSCALIHVRLWVVNVVQVNESNSLYVIF